MAKYNTTDTTIMSWNLLSYHFHAFSHFSFLQQKRNKEKKERKEKKFKTVRHVYIYVLLPHGDDHKTK